MLLQFVLTSIVYCDQTADLVPGLAVHAGYVKCVQRSSWNCGNDLFVTVVASPESCPLCPDAPRQYVV